MKEDNKHSTTTYYIKNQQDETLAVLFISNCKILQLLINNTARAASSWFFI